MLAATLYADGELATHVNFNVRTLGTTMLRDVTGQGEVPLSDGKIVTVQWEETTQNSAIVGHTKWEPAPEPMHPTTNLFDDHWFVTECDQHNPHPRARGNRRAKL